jgi:hypothetical protein
MASKPGRIEEAKINQVVLDILAGQPNGRATVKTIRGELPKHVNLTSGDQTDSITRENEELWEQQVRNLKSHHNVPGNVFYEGLVRWVRRGVWELTDAGRLHTKFKP